MFFLHSTLTYLDPQRVRLTSSDLLDAIYTKYYLFVGLKCFLRRRKYFEIRLCTLRDTCKRLVPNHFTTKVRSPLITFFSLERETCEQNALASSIKSLNVTILCVR